MKKRIGDSHVSFTSHGKKSVKRETAKQIRLRRVNINMSNRSFYSLITLSVLILLGAGILVVDAYVSSNGVGHSYSELQPCGNEQILKTANGAWSCTDIPSLVGPQGPAGPQGLPGTGPQGPPGPNELAAGATIHSAGRLHIDGEEILYLLNQNGVVIGKEWGGNGDLDVQGRLDVGTTGGDYNSANANWNYNLLLNGNDWTSIGFHDSYHSAGSIKYSNGRFYIGSNDGWGVADLEVGGNLQVGGGLKIGVAQAYIGCNNQDEIKLCYGGDAHGNTLCVCARSPSTGMIIWIPV
jgi:hypothetical protein